MEQVKVMNENELKKRFKELKQLDKLLNELHEKCDEFIGVVDDPDGVTIIDNIAEQQRETFIELKGDVINQLKKINEFVTKNNYLKPLFNCNNIDPVGFSCITSDLTDTILSYIDGKNIEPLNTSNLKNKIQYTKSGIGILFLNYKLDEVSNLNLVVINKNLAKDSLRELVAFTQENKFVETIVTDSNSGLAGIYKRINENAVNDLVEQELNFFLNNSFELKITGIKDLISKATDKNDENILAAAAKLTPTPPNTPHPSTAPIIASSTAAATGATVSGTSGSSSSSATTPGTGAPVSGTPATPAATELSGFRTVTVDDENLKQINDVVITARYNNDQHALEFKELKIMTDSTQPVETYTIKKTGLETIGASTFKDNLESNKNPIKFGYENKIIESGRFFGKVVKVSQDYVLNIGDDLTTKLGEQNWTKATAKERLENDNNLNNVAIKNLENDLAKSGDPNSPFKNEFFKRHFKKGENNKDILADYVVYKLADDTNKDKIKKYFESGGRTYRAFNMLNWKPSLVKNNTFDKQKGGSKTKKYRKRITKRKRKYRKLTRRG